MYKRIAYLLFFVVSFLFLDSCITTRQLNYMQPPKNYIPAYQDTVHYKEYTLKPGDRLFIQVYSMDDKTNALFNGTNNSNIQMMTSADNSSNMDLYTYMVNPDGTIHFPLVGDVVVAGKTVRETKTLLENVIRPILTINSVDVRIVDRSFSIIGGGKSGKYVFPREKVNVFQAIAMAGDLGFYADRSKVRILRETANGNVIKTFDLRSADIVNSEFYYIEPNDVIFIQPLPQEFFGVTTFWAALSTLITTVSFGLGVYYLFIPKTN